MKHVPSESDLYKNWIKSEWFKTRPANVRSVARRYPPYWLYQQKMTGYKCRLYSYEETADEQCHTCSIIVLIEDNPTPDDRFMFPLTQSRKVFNVPFDDLVKYKVLQAWQL